MKDPCRICAVRLVGSQCRWIFSTSAQRKLQVILSHVLGWELTRDGRGEFLCGKCVFQLEKVVQCDVNVSQLQEEHNTQIQKLQAEKEHLIQCIIHIYTKNNQACKSDVESTSCEKTSRAGSPDDEAGYPLASEGRLFRERGRSHMETRMRRCVSLDVIVSRGALPARSNLKSNRMGSATGLHGSIRNLDPRVTLHQSQNTYLDVVQRKGTLPRPGVKDRSTSLQSLNFSLDPPSDPPPKPKPRESKVFAARRGVPDDPRGKVQARALHRSSSSQPSVIIDLIQILRCISKQHFSAPAGSHIPVLKRVQTGPLRTRAKGRHRAADWKSLDDLTEEFDDKYTPVRVMEVVVSWFPGVLKTLESV